MMLELSFERLFICDIGECVGKIVPKLGTVVQDPVFFSGGLWEREVKFVCLSSVMSVNLSVCGEIVCEVGRKVVVEVVVHKQCRLKMIDIGDF